MQIATGLGIRDLGFRDKGFAVRLELVGFRVEGVGSRVNSVRIQGFVGIEVQIPYELWNPSIRRTCRFQVSTMEH